MKMCHVGERGGGTFGGESGNIIQVLLRNNSFLGTGLVFSKSQIVSKSQSVVRY